MLHRPSTKHFFNKSGLVTKSWK